VSDQPRLFFGCHVCVALDGQLRRETVDAGRERATVEVLLRERIGEESFDHFSGTISPASQPTVRRWG